MNSLKPPRCRHCSQRMPEDQAHLRIHPDCVGPWWNAFAAKRAKKEARAEKVKDRATRERLETIPQLIKKAQVAFNAYIRERDHGLRCISCGTDWGEASNSRDAGHYRSRGSAGHLRFHEDNCHSQCKACNRFGAGMVLQYRAGLIAKIGMDRVTALESSNEAKKWTREELRAIRSTYTAKLKALKQERENGR